MYRAKFLVKLVLQLALILLITYIGTEVQKLLHIPLAGSIVGLILFFLLLQFKIIPESWIDVGLISYSRQWYFSLSHQW